MEPRVTGSGVREAMESQGPGIGSQEARELGAGDLVQARSKESRVQATKEGRTKHELLE